MLTGLQAGWAVAQEAEQSEEQASTLAEVVVKEVVVVEPWSTRADRLIGQLAVFEKSAEDVDEFFVALDRVLHDRIHIINRAMRGAVSPTERVDVGRVDIGDELPAEIVTIEDLYVNIGELYSSRLRLLEHLSPQMYLEVTATDVIGVGQLRMEVEYIWEQLRFRALNLRAATERLWHRVQIAPLPAVWYFIQLLLVIAVFRWWRKWLPDTLARMQVSLTEVRPRSAAVMRRIHLIWYIEQLRRPLEWMLFFTVLFSMISLQGLNLLASIVESIVRWILLGWFSVAMLNAFSARGAAGLTGADASIRLHSLRLVAAWLVLLGLGLDLASDLTGVATLYAWVWRLFQVLALPVLLVLLAWWRKPIFMRLERERENSDTVRKILQHQTGLRSFGSAANGAFWLLANGLRRSLMRMFLRVGDGQSLSFGGATAIAGDEVAVDARAGVTDEARTALLYGESGYDKHARSDRRKLIRWANNSQTGVVAVVGERGIGKGAFMADVASALAEKAILFDCANGQYSEIEDALCAALSIDSPSSSNISDALKEQDIRTVLIKNLHRLSRPVVDGQLELDRFTDLVESVSHRILWVISFDSFTWQFIRRVRDDQASFHDVIELAPWTEDQLSVLFDMRNDSAGLKPDFSAIQVPSEHAVTSYDTAEERNKAGVYRMIWTLSGGNPATALLMWVACLYYEEEGDEKLCVRLPVQPLTQEVDTIAHNILLVLRCIAQSELISEADIVDNLRLPAAAVSSAMHYSASQGWIEPHGRHYRLTMIWFKTITRVLARQNLLAR